MDVKRRVNSRARCKRDQAEFDREELDEAFRICACLPRARTEYATAGRLAYEAGKLADRRISMGIFIAAAIGLGFHVRRPQFSGRNDQYRCGRAEGAC